MRWKICCNMFYTLALVGKREMKAKFCLPIRFAPVREQLVQLMF
ncbi:hypothetical protein OIU74_008841, partial [Salix koriyanagi]